MSQMASIRIASSDQPSTYQNSVSCTNCMLKGSCLPIALEASNIAEFNEIVQRARPIHKGEHVYREDQSFSTLYAVRSGALKAYSLSESGEEQVTQFYLPGDIFGVDGLSRNRYATSIAALETSAVCAISFERLSELSARIPSLQRHLFQLMSQIIIRDQEFITQLSKHSAERRVAAFLLRISQYQIGRKFSVSKIRLPMTRRDISCYLGLTIETVSRIFSRFQKIGLLTAENRELVILRLDWLNELAGGISPSSATPIVNRSIDDAAIHAADAQQWSAPRLIEPLFPTVGLI